MRNRKFVGSGLALVVCLVLVTIGIMSFVLKTGQPDATSTQPPLVNAVAATPSPYPNTPAVTVSNTKTVAPSLVAPSLLVVLDDPGVQVGQLYNRVYSTNWMNIKVAKVADVPLISAATALQTLVKKTGDDVNNLAAKGVTVSATYGAVTQGQRGSNGLWNGEQNISLANCDIITGKCTPTGEVLDHLENRLMWVLDVSGVDVAIPSGICETGKTCQVPANANHSIYLIDAKGSQVILNMSYKQ